MCTEAMKAMSRTYNFYYCSLYYSLVCPSISIISYTDWGGEQNASMESENVHFYDYSALYIYIIEKTEIDFIHYIYFISRGD